ncbi:MAG: HD domain-containing response regulator [Clostridiales bacterium]|nr:HD domain-containing response regulator [Clostridiales bacterium]
MRKNKIVNQQKEFSILALDDDKLMTETIQSYFQTAGYRVDTENDPTKAADRIRTKQYDILLLDFLMRPICGDEVVRQIREFDHDLFIILLTGHKSMAPPIRTIRELDIQGYFEKSERFDQLELLIESCAKSIRQMRTIRSYRDGLQKIFELIPVLNCQQSVDEILSKVLEQVSELLSCPSSCVYLDFAQLRQKFTLDNDTKAFRGIGEFEGQEQFGSEIYQNLLEGDRQLTADPDKHLLIAPLFTEGHQLFGSLVAQLSEKVKDEASQLFEVYSKQVGSIVSNQLLHYLLEEQNKKLSDAYAILRQNHLETINVVRQMVDAKDFYTRGHSDRVSFYAVKIAQAMNKSEAYIDRLKVAGLFHDIGKIGIPDGILQKPGRLTEEEYAQIKQHPVLGGKILKSISSFHDILPFVEAHHERIDGFGYPYGLSGSDIPEESRIISVADAFDAMTSKRTYRDNLSLPEAIAELKRGKNTQFDGDIVDVFLGLLDHFDDFQKQLSWTFSDAVLFEQKYGGHDETVSQ